MPTLTLKLNYFLKYWTYYPDKYILTFNHVWRNSNHIPIALYRIIVPTAFVRKFLGPNIPRCRDTKFILQRIEPRALLSSREDDLDKVPSPLAFVGLGWRCLEYWPATIIFAYRCKLLWVPVDGLHAKVAILRMKVSYQVIKLVHQEAWSGPERQRARCLES